MTHEQFRSEPDLLVWARELFRSDNFRLAMEAMKSQHPVRQTAPKGISPTDANIMLGEQTGWDLYEQRLLLLGEPVRSLQPLPEPDYLSGEEESKAEEES